MHGACHTVPQPMFFHLELSHQPAQEHFEISPPFSGHAFKAPLFHHCAVHMFHLHLAFAYYMFWEPDLKTKQSGGLDTKLCISHVSSNPLYWLF